ncbi:MAG: hypothetical protein GF344_09220, partial [Chitinivibrionales bacterium]|nr:hypothetical protein [Chitinivibrionales bacterium]MBD3357031.1 hypothetical protein [Chitinivibrionales bacterium]
MQNKAWPVPPGPEEWWETYTALHLWSQIVGKIRLRQMPWINHSWHVPYYVTAYGLTTSLIPYGPRAFEIEFDFLEHRLRITISDGKRRSFSLKSLSVCDFYNKVFRALDDFGMRISIWPMPVEIPGPVVPFSENDASIFYDENAVERIWRALVQI